MRGRSCRDRSPRIIKCLRERRGRTRLEWQQPSRGIAWPKAICQPRGGETQRGGDEKSAEASDRQNNARPSESYAKVLSRFRVLPRANSFKMERIMSRKIYPFAGHPPVPGDTDKRKTANGSRGRLRLRVKKRARKQRRLDEVKLIKMATRSL